MKHERTLLIHIGYPKTGTTWLQKIVFSNENAGFIPIGGERSTVSINWFLEDVHFNWNPNKIRSEIDAYVSDLPENKTAVISQEILLGDPATQKYHGECVINRIYSAYPNAKILITIRDQVSIILSAYKEYILGGGTYNFERFIGLDMQKKGFLPVCQYQFFKYDVVIDYIINLFGKDNVKVLPLELLKYDPNKYLGELFSFSGQEYRNEIIDMTNLNPIHVGISGPMLEIFRYANKYIPKPDNKYAIYPLSWLLTIKSIHFLHKIIPQRINNRFDLSKKHLIIKHFKEEFISSNKKLATIIDSDLPDEYYFLNY